MSQSIRRAAAAFGCSTALLVGGASLSVAAAPVASAEQRVADLTQVCKENYKQPRARVGQVAFKLDPYSFYCYLEQTSGSVGVPIGVSMSSTEQDLGDLDVQKYCSKHWPGSKANGRMFGPQPYWTCDS